MEKYPEFISKDNLANFISTSNLESYNGCHFWTNFEIADLRFYRSEAYLKYFDHLDHAGGFYYEVFFEYILKKRLY
jgi:alpha 1,2-mannosyltransferase